jgi:hypothetical protein
MKRFYSIFFPAVIMAAGIMAWTASCVHEADISDQPEICFEGQVLPIFLNSCAIAACHDGTGESDLRLDSYLDISHTVVPYDPEASESYKAITASWGENQMPPGQPLSLDNRTIIRLWIEQGAGLTICPEAGGGPDDGYVNPRACFTRDILPVLVSRCGSPGCHDEITHEEGYIFTSYSSAMKAVKPGNVNDSKLYKVITDDDPDDRMPPQGKTQLLKAEIDSIAKWISYGALNENCGEVCDTINPVTFSAVVLPVINKYCTGCHSGTAPQGGVTLTSYSNISAAAASGILVKVLRGNGAPEMPPSGAFSECRIRQIELWVADGYKNN